MSQAGLLIEDRQAVRWLTLHRPQAAHALDQSLHLALQEQLQIAVQEPRIQCVVLSASGERAFCAGADLKEFASLPPQEAALRRRHLLLDTLLALIDFPKPLLAQVGGAAVGAGAMLALACDDILASAQARFQFPEVHLGMASPMGCLMMEWRAGARLAQSMVQGGKPCSAEQAHSQGWVQSVHVNDSLSEAVWTHVQSLQASAGFATNKAWLHAPWRVRLIQATEAATRADATKFIAGN